MKPEEQSSSSSSSNGCANAQSPGAQATTLEPVYPIRPSILQHPTSEPTASEVNLTPPTDAAVPDEASVHVFDAQPEWDFQKGFGLSRTHPHEYDAAERLTELPGHVDAQTDYGSRTE